MQDRLLICECRRIAPSLRLCGVAGSFLPRGSSAARERYLHSHHAPQSTGRASEYDAFYYIKAASRYITLRASKRICSSTWHSLSTRQPELQDEDVFDLHRRRTVCLCGSGALREANVQSQGIHRDSAGLDKARPRSQGSYH